MLHLILQFVIYKESFEKDSSTFKEYIQHFINQDLKIPFIIYADKRIVGEEEELLNQYSFSALANFPGSLTTTIISMSNLLSYEGGNEIDR